MISPLHSPPPILSKDKEKPRTTPRTKARKTGNQRKRNMLGDFPRTPSTADWHFPIPIPHFPPWWDLPRNSREIAIANDLLFLSLWLWLRLLSFETRVGAIKITLAYRGGTARAQYLQIQEKPGSSMRNVMLGNDGSGTMITQRMRRISGAAGGGSGAYAHGTIMYQERRA